MFSWVGTLWDGVINLATPMLFALGFIFTFVLGGLSGVWLALVPIDVHVSGTYFIVAHIHYVLFGGSVFTIYAGLYFWYPKMTGQDVQRDARQVALLAHVHHVQRDVLPDALHRDARACSAASRTTSRSTRTGTCSSRSCAFMLGASTFIFVYNAIVSWIRGEPAPANPWRALTLEWQVSSPPPVFNFDSQPRIVGGPYNYGQPGARHAVFDEPAPVPAARAH